FNVHALGGNEMMQHTVYEVGNFCKNAGLARPKIIAVTVLTSSSTDELHAVGIEDNADGEVLRLARLARNSGLDGVGGSPLEAALIRAECGREFMIVTPGVRLENASNNDQKRVMTPSGAVQAGADCLVIGRPITEARDLRFAAERILREISSSAND